MGLLRCLGQFSEGAPTTNDAFGSFPWNKRVTSFAQWTAVKYHQLQVQYNNNKEKEWSDSKNSLASQLDKEVFFMGMKKEFQQVPSEWKRGRRKING